MDKKPIPEDLLKRYLNGTATDEERAWVESWHQRDLASRENETPDAAEISEVNSKMRKVILQHAAPPHRSLWPRITAAASIVVLLGIGGYFVLHHQKPVAQLVQNDVAPFSRQTILKTHGVTLQLDSSKNGQLANYSNIKIARQTVSYTNTTEAEAIYDTLQVPAGGKPYHLQLSDGSQVIVNVASALRFPENFRQHNREIELIAGEAYFTIVHNAAAPLTIKAKDQLIEDIGTEFNVNTYDDEPNSRTTLVTGAININSQALLPGQQAIVSDHQLSIVTANIAEVTAWTKGYFRFNGENIQAVMRELARWYNIEVRYEGPISKEGYYLKIARSMNISAVLRVLERTNSVHFKIEGRRVTVSSKK